MVCGDCDDEGRPPPGARGGGASAHDAPRPAPVDERGPGPRERRAADGRRRGFHGWRWRSIPVSRALPACLPKTLCALRHWTLEVTGAFALRTSQGRTLGRARDAMRCRARRLRARSRGRGSGPCFGVAFSGRPRMTRAGLFCGDEVARWEMPMATRRVRARRRSAWGRHGLCGTAAACGWILVVGRVPLDLAPRAWAGGRFGFRDPGSSRSLAPAATLRGR